MPENRKKILAATNNQDKLREISQILEGTGWQVVGLAGVPKYPKPAEDADTLAENALIKAREGFKRTGLLTLADDTGLEVDALGGEPGVHSARYAGENASYRDNVERLLREMKDKSDRKARFKTVMALVGENTELWWEGSAEGIILEKPRGENGFGYDPIFLSPELGITFAEATPADKNSVSHRGYALRQLLAHLGKIREE